MQKIFKFEYKNLLPLTIEETASHKSQKRCYICAGEFDYESRSFQKVKDHCYFTGTYIGATHAVFNLRCVIPQEVSIYMHDGSNYYSHLIIKYLVGKFENSDFSCLGGNTEKYIRLSVLVDKNMKSTNKKTKEESKKTIKYQMKFIDSCGCMSTSLSNLTDNLSEKLHKKMCWV